MHDLSSLFAVCTIILTVDVKGNAGVIELSCCCCPRCDASPLYPFIHLATVAQKVDSDIQWINLYPVDSATGFPNTYPLDSDLSSG